MFENERTPVMSSTKRIFAGEDIDVIAEVTDAQPLRKEP
jgi:hypothetical protein